uniref:Dr1-associated corepressor n=1 Tax=Sander lucioperca TaxID=283035 RepID=A0A8C9YZ09_SANLU
MPSKKKKYNARFPPARIKKIMQTDEEIGKVAAAVPVIISRALELFLESLLTKACHVTQSRNAKTMTTSHLKQCIELEQQFDFLKDLVATVPDMQGEGEENHTEGGGEKVPRRGRKPGSGRKNGGGWLQRQGQEVVWHRIRARGGSLFACTGTFLSTVLKSYIFLSSQWDILSPEKYFLKACTFYFEKKL